MWMVFLLRARNRFSKRIYSFDSGSVRLIYCRKGGEDGSILFCGFRLCGNNESSSSIPLLSTSWTSLEQQQQAWRQA